ncbi:MAG: hypothetical protein CVT60_07055 [Actinobacteria bacterium HGW-Actinobacteria-10]|jgi:hypothetical protein|nr:MAG: hypothetical protein CVT60_07055 [Actinobacteria bacterium HGW-Actinobacteria-10]
MNTTRVRLLISSVMVVGLFALAGCAESTEPEAEGGMTGYIASERDAQLEIDQEQASSSMLTVDRVKAPENAWIVVHLDDDGMPGDRVGLQPIDEGESEDVSVQLDNVTTENVIVAVHADRGEEGEFEFDGDDMAGSPDKPFFVNGEELAKVVPVPAAQ